MCDGDRPRGDLRRTELESVTCWPLVGVATGVLLCLGAAAAALAVASARQAPTRRSPTAAARPQQPPPKPTTHRAQPSPVVEVRRVERPAPSPKEEQDLPAVVRLKLKRPDPDPARPILREPRSESEHVLKQSLEKQARELDLESEKGTCSKLYKECEERHDEAERRGLSIWLDGPLKRLVQKRDDLRGLPLLAGKACETSRAQAKVLAKTSERVRTLQARKDPYNLCSHLQGWGEEFAEEGETAQLHVRPLEQMLQTDGSIVRCELVETLTKVRGKAATQAIARRAAFDPCLRVRVTAVEALKKRNAADAREVLLAALRHPWAPAADHAALALVALEDNEAVPALRELFEQPDPCAPYVDEEGKWRQKELVRVNHLRNCLLCHPPSLSRDDLVTGPIPTPGEPLPERRYYSGRGSQMVKADVVFIRQDFSVMHEVEEPNKWPSEQRFDYLVRTRERDATAAEAEAKKARAKTYPQREAVRWALAMLTAEPASLKRRR